QRDVPKRRMRFQRNTPSGVPVFLAFTVTARARLAADAELFVVNQGFVRPLAVGVESHPPAAKEILFTRDVRSQHHVAPAGLGGVSSMLEGAFVIEQVREIETQAGAETGLSPLVRFGNVP